MENGCIIRSNSFLNKNFDEATVLLRETRDYIRFEAPLESMKASPIACLQMSREAMRVTARLTQVMSWLMIQRTIRDEEHNASIVENLLKNPLLGENACLDTKGEEMESIPSHLKDLLKRSGMLYMRILRLDERNKLNA